ncbi:MAG: hypothetical protein A3F91_09180 [Flavobacteria bacterium RIFCSPLOWO2_12_FULL_35_11]|nr:MAG: hypothetical protein A3F91_09180 [Flavobacteria bacterium RIFCSPLOWO2_12_FULL_35_11]
MKTIYSLDRIQQNCFWDYTFTNEEILRMAQEGTDHEVNFLFNKIFANSTRPEYDLRIFTKEVLVKKLEAYVPPRFNNKYFSHRLKVLKLIFDIDKTPIEELRWKK